MARLLLTGVITLLIIDIIATSEQLITTVSSKDDSHTTTILPVAIIAEAKSTGASVPEQKDNASHATPRDRPPSLLLPSDSPLDTTPQTPTTAATEQPKLVYYSRYGIMVIRRDGGGGHVGGGDDGDGDGGGGGGDPDGDGVIVPGTTEEKACTSYYPELTHVPTSYESVAVYPVLDLFEWNPCTTPPPEDFELHGHWVLLDGSDNTNCSVVAAALAVQSYGGNGSLMVRNAVPPILPENTPTLSLAFISNYTYQDLLLSGLDEVYIGVYAARQDSALNYSLLVILLLAACTVTAGSYWSGITRHRLYLESQHLNLCDHSAGGVDSGVSGGLAAVGVDGESDGLEDVEGRRRHEPDYPREETSLNISSKVALFFVLLMCIMLVSLYFLYSYLVYLILAMFALASTGALYSCLQPLVLRLPCGTCRTPYCNLWVVRGQLEVRDALLMLGCVSFTVAWIIVRNESYSWVLQDILGVAFCINMLRMIRLPSLKICTVLLSCLFFYDIFFVFITPLFMPGGTSIMVEVAKGGDVGGEQLPMVFKVPHFTYSEVAEVCGLQYNYNLLGFGDVLVPGLLVSFVHAFDLKTRGHAFRIYFTLNVIAYNIGLVLTFIMLYVMMFAQPALLYLVPCTLIPTVVLAAVRGDLADMWLGDGDQKQSEAAAAAAAAASQKDEHCDSGGGGVIAANHHSHDQSNHLDHHDHHNQHNQHNNHDNHIHHNDTTPSQNDTSSIP